MKSELLAELHSLSNPDLRKIEGMVYEIWEDGEITLQKCGSLYGQRNMHCIVPGVFKMTANVELLPEKTNNNHSLMAVHCDNLVRARELICLLNDFPFDKDGYRYTIPGYKE